MHSNRVAQVANTVSHAPQFVCKQVKQQVESQVRCLPYPTYPTHPLTFFLACAQIKVRDVSAQHFNRAFLICPRLPHLPHPPADFCSCRTPPPRSRRPTTRRGTTCAPSSWPRPRPASRRASRPSSRLVRSHSATTLPPPCHHLATTLPHHLASPHHHLCNSSGWREPGRAQGGLPAGGARDRAPDRPRRAHVQRVGGRLVQRAPLAAR